MAHLEQLTGALRESLNGRTESLASLQLDRPCVRWRDVSNQELLELSRIRRLPKRTLLSVASVLPANEVGNPAGREHDDFTRKGLEPVNQTSQRQRHPRRFPGPWRCTQD